MSSNRWAWWIFFLLVPMTAGNPSSRDIKILNKSGFKCNIFWINTFDKGQLVLNSEEGVMFGAESIINSYIGHEFEVQEVPNRKTGKCQTPDNCLKGHFQVNENHNQAVTLNPGLEMIHEDDKTRARDEARKLVEACRNGIDDSLSPEEQVTELSKCMEGKLEEVVERQEEESLFHAKLRTKLGSQLVGYACDDDEFPASIPVENRTWTYKKTRYTMRVMHTRETSKIVVMEDGFATPAQCQAILKAANDKGNVAWGVIAKNTAVSTYMFKAYSFIKGFLSWPELTMQKQQQLHPNLFVLEKYEPGDGSGTFLASDMAAPEEQCITNEADGTCMMAAPGAEDDNQTSSRLAVTMHLYCQVPKEGGATHFPKAGVHLYPQKRTGQAVFVFHPLDPTEYDFTSERVECPVKEGTKTIVTHSVSYNEGKK